MQAEAERRGNERPATTSVAQTLAMRVALLVANFGTSIVVARSLGPVGRGELAAMSLSLILMSSLATLGLPIALSYRIKRDPQTARRLFGAAVALSTSVGAAVAALGMAGIPLWLHGYSSTVVREAQWLMLLAPVYLLSAVVRAHLEAHGEFVRSMMSVFVPSILTLIALPILELFAHMTPETAAIAYSVPGGVVTLFLVMQLREHMAIVPATFAVDVRLLLSYGLRSYGTDVLNTLSGQVDQAVIVGFLNPAALGIYAVALNLSRLVSIVQQSISTVLFPKAAALDAHGAVVTVTRAARLTAAASVLAGLLLIAALWIALPIVYGTGFVQALPLLPYLIAEAVLASTALVAVQAFMVTGRPLTVTAIQAVWLISTVVLLAILVPRFHLVGAAVALCASSVLRLVITATMYAIRFRAGATAFVPRFDDVRDLRMRLQRLSARMV